MINRQSHAGRQLSRLDQFRLREGLKALALSIQPQYANTFDFNYDVDPIRGQQAIKGFINKIDRRALGSDWNKKPKHNRTYAVGFLEHAASNAHWHTVMRVPEAQRKLLRLEGRELWHELVSTGDLDIELIKSKKAWTQYITKELYLPSRIEDVFVYAPF